jgi:hypothetical protein
MKTFQPVALEFPLCSQHVDAFERLLTSKDELREREDVLPFFRQHEQLAVLMGMFNSRISWVDRIAWEFDIFGDFACDLAVGEKDRGAYCLIEFEDAASNSVFQKQGEKATREWGKRFDHGYSQAIDWAHKLDDLKRTNSMLARFDQHEITYEMVLIAGRDKHLDAGEKRRLDWRSDNVLVGNKKVLCMTFDGAPEPAEGAALGIDRGRPGGGKSRHFRSGAGLFLCDSATARWCISRRRPPVEQAENPRERGAQTQVRRFKSAAEAFWGPTKNVLVGLNGRLAGPACHALAAGGFLDARCGERGRRVGKPAVLLAGFAAYVALYATLWPSRSLFRFHSLKALFLPLAVILVWCCLLRALYHYVAWGSMVCADAR